MDLKSSQIQKYISLSVGILGWFMGGIVFAFNAYAIALKQTFNYTQTELDFISSSGDLGVGLAFPAGLISDSLGPRVACTISLILTTTGFALMCIATKFKVFFATKSWLLCVFSYIAFGGTMFIFQATKTVNCRNYDRKHVGKVLGLLGTIYGVSPAVFSALYDGFFVQGHIEDPENQKLAEFLIVLCVLSLCINLYGIIMLRTVSEEATETSEVELQKLSQDETNELNPNALTKGDPNNGNIEKNKKINDKTELVPKKLKSRPQQELKFWETIQTIQFYYLAIICTIIGGTGGSFTNNITTVVQSARLDDNAIIFTVVTPLCASAGRFLGGMIPDFIFQKWPDIPKSSILLFPGIMSLIGHLLFSLLNKTLGGLITCSVMMALAYGSFYPVNNIVVLELFGLKYLGQNSGMIALGHGVGILTFQKLFAFVYETYSPPGSKYCYGEICFKWYFVLMAIICVCVVFLIFCLMKIERDQRLRYEESLELGE